MRFLGDMGISPLTTQRLRELGHDAVNLRDEGLQRLPDPMVLEKARNEDRILLTHDLDFGFLLADSRATGPSTILFRIAVMHPTNVARHLDSLIPHLPLGSSGFIAVISDSGTRIRLLPIGECGEEGLPSDA